MNRLICFVVGCCGPDFDCSRCGGSACDSLGGWRMLVWRLRNRRASGPPF